MSSEHIPDAQEQVAHMKEVQRKLKVYPELLEALKDLALIARPGREGATDEEADRLDERHGGETWFDTCEAARAAAHALIAKAEGK